MGVSYESLMRFCTNSKVRWAEQDTTLRLYVRGGRWIATATGYCNVLQYPRELHKHRPQTSNRLLFTDNSLLASIDPRLELQNNAPSKGPRVTSPTERWQSSAATRYVIPCTIDPNTCFDIVDSSIIASQKSRVADVVERWWRIAKSTTVSWLTTSTCSFSSATSSYGSSSLPPPSDVR